MSDAIVKYAIYVLERQKCINLRKICQSRGEGGCWIFRIQEDDLTRGGEIMPPSELCILPILNFLTDIKIKYNKNIDGIKIT